MRRHKEKLEEKVGARVLRRSARRAHRLLGIPVQDLKKPLIDGDSDGRCLERGGKYVPCPPGVRAGTRLRKGKPASKRSIFKSSENPLKTRDRKPEERNDLLAVIKRLKDPDSGFSIDPLTRRDQKSGWAISINGKGIALPASKVFDRDGEVKPSGARLVTAFIVAMSDDLQSKRSSQKKVVIGGWHNPETGMVHLDITNVYPKSAISREEAIRIGKRERQISIADLDNISKSIEDGNWDRETVIDTGGDGGEIIDLKELESVLDDLDARYGKVDRGRGPRVEEGPEGVSMLLADPIEELAEKHGVRKDWDGIYAVSPERRKSIADFYDEGKEITADRMSREVREAYEAMAREIDAQYEMLTKELKIMVEFVDEDPYADFLEMRQDFIENRRLKIMRTAVTGSHPFFTDEQNDKFRAVHDAFGHLATGRGFDRHGEEAAYQAHRTMFTERAAAALATETRGQNMFLIDRGFFGEQKLLLLPEEMRKALAALMRIATKSDKAILRAKVDSDIDNRYSVTGSHHVTGGRILKNKKSSTKK